MIKAPVKVGFEEWNRREQLLGRDARIWEAWRKWLNGGSGGMWGNCSTPLGSLHPQVSVPLSDLAPYFPSPNHF
jgi:hypothetical protein